MKKYIFLALLLAGFYVNTASASSLTATGFVRNTVNSSSLLSTPLGTKYVYRTCLYSVYISWVLYNLGTSDCTTSPMRLAVPSNLAWWGYNWAQTFFYTWSFSSPGTIGVFSVWGDWNSTQNTWSVYFAIWSISNTDSNTSGSGALWYMDKGMITTDFSKYYCMYVNTGKTALYLDPFPHSSAYICPSSDSLWNDFLNFNNWNFIPQTCSDWIKNQNETAIDYGGVCWNNICATVSRVTGYTYLPYTYAGGSFSTSSSSTSYYRAGTSWYDFSDTSKYYTLTSTLSTLSGSLANMMGSWATVETPLLGNGDQFGLQVDLFTNVPDSLPTAVDSNAVNYLKITGSSWSLQISYKPLVPKSYDADSGYMDGSTYIDLQGSWRVGDYIRFPSRTRHIYIRYSMGTSARITAVQWWNFAEVKTNVNECHVVDPATQQQIMNLNDSAISIVTKIFSQSGAINPSIGSGMTMTGTTMELYKQMLFSCPKELDKITYTGFSFFEFGFSFTVPLTDITIDLHPFRALSCPVRSIIYFYNSF